MAERKQVTVIFGGNVQGVGFRFTTRSIAKDHAVAGHVRNLPDGDVELVAEGEEDALRAFLGEVRREMATYIRRENAQWSPVTNAYRTFSIAH